MMEGDQSKEPPPLSDSIYARVRVCICMCVCVCVCVFVCLIFLMVRYIWVKGCAHYIRIFILLVWIFKKQPLIIGLFCGK